jgi:O-antigen ligase
LVARTFLYVICAIWTGLINPIQQIFFGIQGETEDVDLTSSTWLSFLFNLVIVVSGISLFVATLFRGKIKYGKYHGLLLLCMIVLLSTLWSIAPEITFKRALTFTGSMLLLIYFVEKIGTDHVFRCIVQQLVIAGVLSAITGIVWKEYSWQSLDSFALKGIYSHKNVLGYSMSVGILAILYLYLKVRQKKFLLIAIFFLFCDALSTSGTAITEGIIFFYIFSLYLLAERTRRPRIISIVGSLPVLGVIAVAAISPDTLFGTIGKDATLTGRTDVWPFVLHFISERPWLGWGYRSFWQQDNPLAVNIWETLGWIIPGGHNGFLDLLTDVGYLGSAAFVYVFLASAIRGVQNLKVGNAAIGITAVMSFVGYLSYAITEGILLNPQIQSIIFYLIAISGTYEYRRVRCGKLGDGVKKAAGSVGNFV